MKTRAIVPVLAVLIGIGGAGCGKALRLTKLQNQPPTVSLTWAPIASDSKVFYIYKLNWVGYDPDGRVVRFEYAIDAPTATGAAINWRSTTRNEETIRFESATPEPGFEHTPVPRSEDFHRFRIRAVDNQGAVSEPVERAFYSYGVAPTVNILAPVPQTLLVARVTPAVRVSWSGRDFIDPYGSAFDKPLYYKYTLFKRGSPGVNWDAWLQDPDSLRREVAPAFTDWDSIGPENPEVQFTNLTTGSEYLFVVVAFGRSGAYSSIFGLTSNMLRMRVELAGVFGPKITLFNSFFQYTYSSGGFSLDPARAIQLQVPAAVPITFNWTAEPPQGSVMKRYRWVLDLVALDDETPRVNQNDWYHWSPWSGALSATIGPFTGSEGDTGEIHNFYLEAEDINGLVSLGWVQFRVYRPVFDRDILVVNDTRFQADQVSGIQPPGRTDSLRAPTGVWPSRAELDTFLFAVGGVPWRMKTPGLLSPRGIFKGYSFDTLGTRYGLTNPTIPLGLLGHYRHIVWMSDRAGSYTLGPNSNTLPMPTLYYMSDRNRQNTLATWVGQGGQLWALGGGFGHQTNAVWNRVPNDANQVRTYNYDANPSLSDLNPGLFMYDLTHWRSQFRVYGPVFVRVARFDQPDPTAVGQPNYWKGGVFTNPDVNYTSLPTTLGFRTPATDPIWPFRTPTEFYIGNTGNTLGVYVEYLTLENRILEMVPAPTEANPDATIEVSKLDSLYLVYGRSYPKQMNQSYNGEGVNVMMTYYHGQDNAPLVFTGMAIWDFRRTDCQSLVDFVLGRLWGLQNNSVNSAASRATTPNFVRRAAVAASPVQRSFVPVDQPAGQPVWQPVGSATRQPVGQPSRPAVGQPSRQPVRQPVGKPAGTSTIQRWR